MISKKLYSIFTSSVFLGSVFCFARVSYCEDISLEGGETTITDASSQAYDHLLANTSTTTIEDKHNVGRSGFDRNFAHARINGKITLGPQFNNVSCSGCHTNNGRGTPTFDRAGSQTVVKVSLPSGRASVPGGPVPLSSFGLQLHDHAISKVKPDARLQLAWEFIQSTYNDGAPFELRKPIVTISVAKGKKIPSNVQTSLRRAPPVFGAGLIDSIDEATILSLADPDDINGDGISGQPNMVWNLKSKKTTIGRFGFKAASPTAIQQIASAYAFDMGVTNPLVRLADKQPDIPQRILDATTFYTRTLAVPRARNMDPVNETIGQALFVALHCNSCHVMTLITGTSDIAELSHQTIHPFTDLLLHDMGPGLADGRPEFSASGSEWRTTPLWGIGLTITALTGAPENYLHDGRARSLEEAILWHSGEAQTSSDGFKSLTLDQRNSLISFLHSL